jgi:hypothetical protein
MKILRTMKIIKLNALLVLAVSLITLNACTKLSESPEGCVVSFIVAAEKRNMARAWENISPEAQAYYNTQGTKMRKSGKGALENEIALIEKFKTVKTDYTVEPDKQNNNIVNFVMKDGSVVKVETVSTNGSYMIKDEVSVKNLLNAISAGTKKGDGY